MVSEGDCHGSPLFEARVPSGPPLVDTHHRVKTVIECATAMDVDAELTRALTLPGHESALVLLDESGNNLIFHAQNAYWERDRKVQMVQDAVTLAHARVYECAGVSSHTPKRKTCPTESEC